MCVILKDRCWVLHLPFVRMVKFEFFAHLSVNHFSHPVVFNLILLKYNAGNVENINSCDYNQTFINESK